MSFCSKCGNKVNELDKFCPVCGNKLNPTAVANSAKQLNSSNNIVNSICTALLIIGLVFGYGSISYIINCELAATDMTDSGWNYHYNGGRELAICITILAIISLIIGICLKIGANNKR